ncbi:hypothetical protein QR680_003461 [Steinernema hermaphroditum]|uniref:P-type ATPase C-terminal domain-containing protein n=1 Tax=Steinernema hermaphroditum TaxID=289476 RepID=A0AA39H6W7_9BILA|nr:hypothetical protein QR680_003461 [Steinernema hermaphroditum]
MSSQRPRILVTNNAISVARLQEIGEVIINPRDGVMDRKLLLEMSEEVDAIFCLLTDRIDEEFLNHAAAVANASLKTRSSSAQEGPSALGLSSDSSAKASNQSHEQQHRQHSFGGEVLEKKGFACETKMSALFVVWYSTAVPLFFVLAVSAVKDAYDDIQRHRSDRQVNNRISYVVRDGRLLEEKWMNVKVGDIVRMENEHFIAADLLLLSTSEPHGLCYIETAELDGETNLKTRSAAPETADMGDIVKQISAFRGHITCEAPNNRLDTFEGRLEFENKLIPLNNSMMLLRGCRLRNTRWCYGLVVFAGKETKLMMNSGRSKFKRTSLDRFLNVLIMGIGLFLIAMCLICTILCGVWEWSTGRHFTEYLDWDRTIIPNTSEKSGKQIALIALLMFFSYIILLNTVVPISLYVSVEVLRFAHSMFINFDREMYYGNGDIAARARTTTLNEELGQETAINIGYSCRLLTEEMKEVFVVNGKEEKEVEVQLKSIKRKLDAAMANRLGRDEPQPRSTFYHMDVDRYINDIIAMLDEKDSELENKDKTETYEMQYRGFGRRVSHVTCSREPPRLYEERGGANYNPSSAVSNDATGRSPGADLNNCPNWPNDNERTGGYGLVITGEALEHALKAQFERALLDIGCMCSSVICCRVTPLQKAKVVNLVKRNKKSVTLAVGDGANDVSMIKTAHIGVGISGQEGMQAVLASDYSIGQFRYLQRLLLVHGRWSYYRMAKFLRYFFYKNFSFTLTHFWYSFFCGYSAQLVYDPVLIALYNMCFTALPVLVMGIFDQDVNDKYSLSYVKLYIPGQYNLFFNMRTFVYSVLHGIISSIVLFFVPYGALYMGSDHSGRDMNDYPLLAFTVFTGLIIVVTVQIMLDTAYWTTINHVVIWGSLLFYFGTVFVFYEALPISAVSNTQSVISYGVAFRAMCSPHFWFSITMVVALLILPVVINRFFWFHTHPTYADRLRVKKRIDKELCQEPVEVPLQPIPRTAATRRSRRSSLRSGYAFSHSQGFGDLIAKGKLFKNIENMRTAQER